MICPRCSVAEISPETHVCVLCGFSPTGVLAPAQPEPVDEIHETVQRELGDRFELQVLLRKEQHTILYLALDLEDDRVVALRLIPRLGPVDGDLVHRFAQAATLAAGLRHPHLVPMPKHGVTQFHFWCAMEPVKGRTLATLVEQQGRMELPRCLALLEQVASGLEYVHRNGVVHGGINPRSVLVQPEGWARISDVGTLAAIYRAGGPKSPWQGLLDLPYVAPEMTDSRLVGPAADQYSLAAIAYYCLTARPPVSGDTVDDVRRERALTMTPIGELLPDLPVSTATAITRALRDDPSERFGGVLDFVAVLSGGSVKPSGGLLTPSSRPAGETLVVVPEGEQPRRRIRWGVILTLLAVAAAAVVGMRWLQRPLPQGWADAPSNITVPSAAGPAAAPPQPPAPAQAAADSAPAVVSQPTAPRRQPPPRPAAAPGKLSVNATPWGAVYLDDQLLGNTPRANVEVPSGDHLLRVVRDGFVTFERRIRIEPGGTLRLLDIVLQPLEP
jgi:hypothetical protein